VREMTSNPPPIEPDRIRAGNADRERVVQRLNDAFAEGRLDVHELDERVAAAYAAKTVGELQPLLADLPPPAPGSRRPEKAGATSPAPSMPYVPERSRQKGSLARRTLIAHFRTWLGVVMVNIVIWAVVCLGSGQLVYFWPIWVAGPWGAVLLAQLVTWRSRDDRSQH
jgi:Domain of unknown function (DUF1707)